MKIKVDRSGFVTQVKFDRYESGAVVPYQSGNLCANTYTVVLANEDANINSPAMEAFVSGEALIEFWKLTSEEWYDQKTEKYALECTGLFFKYDKQLYTLLTIPRTKMFTAVEANFIQSFVKTHSFYLCNLHQQLPAVTHAIDLVAELGGAPAILAVRYNGELTAFIAPALIPEEIMRYFK